MVRRVQAIDDIDERETDTVEFDFTAIGPVSASPAPVVTCVVLSGEDATPAQMLVGSSAITPNGFAVQQGIRGRPEGVTYRLVCTVTIAGFVRVLAAVIKTVRY